MGEVAVKNVWKRYGEVEAVKGLSFDVKEKECVVILGSSGAGKTSTLKMIAGLEEISEGEIFIDGHLVNYLDPHERNIAMTFETYALYPNMSVYDNLAFPLRSPRHRMAEKDIRGRVTRTANLLGIGMLLDRLPGQLSQGQKQRVGLGRTLVREPSVFLFDEPLSHLDAKLRNRMRTDIKRIQEELGTTSVFVTHDYMEALALANRIVVLDKGMAQQIGTPGEIFNQPANLFVAGIVGDPPANFLDAQVKGHDGALAFSLDKAGCEIPMLPSMAAKLAGRKDGKVRLAIRPMYIAPYLSEQPACQLKGSVYSWERIETKGVLTAHVGEAIVIAETAADFPFRPDAPVWMSIDMAGVMAFDPSTTAAIAG